MSQGGSIGEKLVTQGSTEGLIEGCLQLKLQTFQATCASALLHSARQKPSELVCCCVCCFEQSRMGFDAAGVVLPLIAHGPHSKKLFAQLLSARLSSTCRVTLPTCVVSLFFPTVMN